MRQLLQNGQIKKKTNEQTVSYLLSEDSFLSSTGMKALKNMEEHGFLPCVPVRFNGQIKLLFLTGSFVRLESVLPSMSSEEFQKTLGVLLQRVKTIKEHGILKCSNLELAEDCIFVGKENTDVRLICLPVKNPDPLAGTGFDAYLQAQLLKMFLLLPEREQIAAAALKKKLEDPFFSLEKTAALLGWEEEPGAVPKPAEDPSTGGDPRPAEDPSAEDPLHLVYDPLAEARPVLLFLDSMDISQPLRFAVDHMPYKIGRKQSVVDGVIPKEYIRVGRMHCRIEQEDGQFVLYDENSTNGTWVNEKFLEPGTSAELHQGDCISLAGMKFRVTIL